MIIDGYALNTFAPLGKGAHGVVVDAVHLESNQLFVAKRMNVSSAEGMKIFCNERDHLKKLSNSRYIVKLVKSVIYKKYGYLIMERMETDLMSLIEACSLTTDQREFIFFQLAQAISDCHACGIAHLDIKPDNVLINTATFEVRLCDFGLSQLCNGIGVQGKPGTIPYISPELCRGLREVDGKKSDLWSLAVLYHVLLTDYWPFVNNEDDMVDAVKNGELSFANTLTKDQRYILQGLTQKDPALRFSIDKVLAHLNIPQRVTPKRPNVAQRIIGVLRVSKAQFKTLPLFFHH